MSQIDFGGGGLFTIGIMECPNNSYLVVNPFLPKFRLIYHYKKLSDIYNYPLITSSIDV